MDRLDIFAIKDPKSPITESFRTLRTNIQFSSLDKSIQTVMMTSSGPGEGKSTVSSNLAVITAEGGKKTLLIDCDLRKPRIHKIFKMSQRQGLSDVLIGEVDIKRAIQRTSIDNLFILPSGTIPPNPAELMGSARMKNLIESLKQEYDFIVLDTPPVVVVTDAQLLSSSADGCIIVVASGEAQKEAAVRAKELLEKVNAKILGIVLNKLDTGRKGYYSYYYHYYYTEDGTKTKSKDRKSRRQYKVSHTN